MESRCGSGAYGNLTANPSEGYEYTFNGVDAGVFGDPWPNIAPTRAQMTSDNLLMPDTLAALRVGVEPQFLTGTPPCPAVLISHQREGRIRSAERTEVHLLLTIQFYELTFCPLMRTLGTRKEVRHASKTSPIDSQSRSSK